MTKDSMYVWIIILAITAPILGYLVYQQVINESQTQFNKPTQNASSIDSPDWDKIVEFDSTKATEDQSIYFSEAVSRYAVETNILKFSKCKSSPLIARLKKNSEFTMKSTDSDEQVIVFGPHEYALHPGESATVKADFAQVAGIYRYPCRRIIYHPIAGVLQIID